jgi:hypothetical protein
MTMAIPGYSITAKHPEVIEAAVIGIPDPRWTERPLAVVAVKPERQVNEAELKAHLHDFAAKGVISKYGVPLSLSRRCPRPASASSTKKFCARNSPNSGLHCPEQSGFFQEAANDDVSCADPRHAVCNQ